MAPCCSSTSRLLHQRLLSTKQVTDGPSQPHQDSPVSPGHHREQDPGCSIGALEFAMEDCTPSDDVMLGRSFGVRASCWGQHRYPSGSAAARIGHKLGHPHHQPGTGPSMALPPTQMVGIADSAPTEYSRSPAMARHGPAQACQGHHPRMETLARG